MSVDPYGKHISLLYRHSLSYGNQSMKNFGLGNGLYIFLAHLYDNEGINQEQLAEMVKIDKTTTARAVARLVDLGYVARKTSDFDHRAYILSVTEKGAALRSEFLQTLDAWYAPMLRGFTKNDQQLFLSMLEKALTNILDELDADKLKKTRRVRTRRR
ncbi:MarR family transcriptional regulator [Selenomonas sp. TAMA-11512]|uniref:MarR family winged helix-turn-helix transcriptional regulator n=1 Tax=Selenomonas sp. TAMA-11512 TaxID=3095337 RepID=UPI00308F6580|nr:MarR family transcriptional regulator [Selenomonas sp. TAMA-11512]